MNNTFLLGADPELFLLHSDGSPKSAIDVIPGTKEDPHPISKEGHSVQVDNVLLEFNVPPSDNADSMYNDIQLIIDWFYKNIPKNDKLSLHASKRFTKEELTHPSALEFGCDPDFNAWTEEMNEPPNIIDKFLRSAGGHVHISYNNASMERSIALIKALDLFLGVPSILMDSDIRRRKLYGKAGCFRFKTYGSVKGVEYRTLSNFWTTSLAYVKFIYDGVDRALSYIDNEEELSLNSTLGRNINEIINKGNKKLARELINNLNLI